MLDMGFTQKEIHESLSESRYDEVCATYMLLVRDTAVRHMFDSYMYIYCRGSTPRAPSLNGWTEPLDISLRACTNTSPYVMDLVPGKERIFEFYGGEEITLFALLQCSPNVLFVLVFYEDVCSMCMIVKWLYLVYLRMIHTSFAQLCIINVWLLVILPTYFSPDPVQE